MITKNKFKIATLSLLVASNGVVFAAQDLPQGYQNTESKVSEHKCGEGKCGGVKKQEKLEHKNNAHQNHTTSDRKEDVSKPIEKKLEEHKCGEGKCGAKN